MEIDNNQRPVTNFPLLKRTRGRLEFDGEDIEDLLNEIGTPSFIFSEKVLEMQYYSLIECFAKWGIKPFELAFSIKSNPDKRIINVFNRVSSLFEATSIGEMEQILNSGTSGNKIIYTNAVKTAKSIRFALEIGVRYIAIDSLSDMLRIEDEAKKGNFTINVLIRVNPLVELENILFSCSGMTSKIGIVIPMNLEEASEFKQILLHCIESKILSYEGLHVHLGSQIEDITIYKKGLEKIKGLISLLKECGIKTNVLDIGGGFPVQYKQEPIEKISSFAEIVKITIKDSFPELMIIAESGRYLTAPAALLATSIVNIKVDPRKNFIACLDGSFYNTLPDVIVAKWTFPIEKTVLKGKKWYTYRIAGSSNDTLDIYEPNRSKEVYLHNFEELEEGERLVFLQAGAYSLSFNSTYCLEKRPKVYFIEKKG
ncbi:MAG: hypothetical protein EAX86_08705 [Candidatus Heimdallarchaeota archaeon]|nr:hypothetical protein [Candidatus Heimdallarchaeota archaeon]